MKENNSTHSQQNRKIKFLLLNTHGITYHGVSNILKKNFENCEINRTSFQNKKASFNFDQNIDIAIIDASTIVDNEISLVHRILNANSKTKILVLSSNPEDVSILQYTKAESYGFLNPNSSTVTFISAINSLLKGDIFLSNTMAISLLHNIKSGINKKKLLSTLSPNEIKVLPFLVLGEDLKSIGLKMNLKVSTIGTYKSRILRKLNVKNTIQLADLVRDYESLNSDNQINQRINQYKNDPQF